MAVVSVSIGSEFHALGVHLSILTNTKPGLSNKQRRPLVMHSAPNTFPLSLSL